MHGKIFFNPAILANKKQDKLKIHTALKTAYLFEDW